MKKTVTLFSVLLFSIPVYCQHNADNWFFGVLAHVKFIAGIPNVMSPGSMNTNEGCSSASDSLGGLLFYTDGVTVWNKYDQVMPNGTGLLGDNTATQSGLVVPYPGNSSLYFIFTVDDTGGPDGFRYSIVDVTLQSGAGDVTTKNVLLLNNVTEKLTAVQQLQGTGNYWVAVHEWGTDAFYVYSITSTGVQTVPVVSNTGMVHNNSQIQNSYGQMKFNACGNKLALACGYLDTVEVFDFDPATGIVSNPLTLPMNAHVYGIEFSDNSDYLYVSTYDPAATLVQFDLNAGSPTAVMGSKTVLSTTPDIYGLQIAPDGKIYVCKSFNQFLGVINYPTLGGIACNYIDNGLDLDPFFNGVTSSLSLPGFVQSIFRGEVNCSVTGVTSEQNSFTHYWIFPNPSSGSFTLKLLKKAIPIKLEVVDVTGKVVESIQLTEANSFTFGQNLPKGVYFINIKDDSSFEVRKLIKI